MARKKWAEIRAKRGFSAPALEGVEAKKRELRRALALNEIRRALRYTQTELADRLGVEQPEISRIEHQADMFISTLRRFVEGLGGRLEIRAVFDGQEVSIGQFEEIQDR